MEILTVNYNTPDLLDRLIKSIRAFTDVKIRVVDGSDRLPYSEDIKTVCNQDNVVLEQMGYNIGHGLGMHKALTESKYEWALIMDSDTELLEGMLEKFHYTHFYEGFACWVNQHGINVPKGQGILYLHPEILLVNTEKYRQSPYKAIRHGAPMLEVMKGVPDEDKLIIPDDYRELYRRTGRGTIKRWGFSVGL